METNLKKVLDKKLLNKIYYNYICLEYSENIVNNVWENMPILIFGSILINNISDTTFRNNFYA